MRDNGYRRENLHRIGGDGKLESYSAASKTDVSWTFLTTLRDLGRGAAKDWLAHNYDSIGVGSTLDLDRALNRTKASAGEG